jgi:hypothetical protein
MENTMALRDKLNKMLTSKPQTGSIRSQQLECVMNYVILHLDPDDPSADPIFVSQPNGRYTFKTHAAAEKRRLEVARARDGVAVADLKISSDPALIAKAHALTSKP